MLPECDGQSSPLLHLVIFEAHFPSCARCISHALEASADHPKSLLAKYLILLASHFLQLFNQRLPRQYNTFLSNRSRIQRTIMAVIDDLPGVKVEITIEDNSLAEHVENGLVEDERTLTRYIEAVSDQQFEVYIELLPNFDYKGDCIAFVVTVDGKQTDALMLLKTSGFRSIKSKGVEVAGGLIHKYRFADLETGKSALQIHRKG